MGNWGGSFNGGYTDVHWYTMRYARIFAGEVNEINFWHLEAESSIRIDPISRPTSKGITRIVGFRMVCTLYVPNNEYSERYADLEELRASRQLTNVQIGMGSAVHEVQENSGFWRPDFGGGEVALDADEKASVVMALACSSILIETVERRPRAIITLEGLYSKRFFEDGFGQAFFHA